MSGLPNGSRVSIRGGATAEEVAAVMVALDRVLTDGAATTPRRPPWQEAARREAVGLGPVRSRWDLRSHSG